MKIKLPTNKIFESDKEEVLLIQACFATKAAIVFGCRIGMCGTCKVRVSNTKNLLPKNQAEEEFTEGPYERLACQCIITGDIEVEQPR
jgi:ferredoxin